MGLNYTSDNRQLKLILKQTARHTQGDRYIVPLYTGSTVVHSFPQATLRTDNARGQISWHIFAPIVYSTSGARDCGRNVIFSPSRQIFLSSIYQPITWKLELTEFCLSKLLALISFYIVRVEFSTYPSFIRNKQPIVRTP